MSFIYYDVYKNDNDHDHHLQTSLYLIKKICFHYGYYRVSNANKKPTKKKLISIFKDFFSKSRKEGNIEKIFLFVLEKRTKKHSSKIH